MPTGSVIARSRNTAVTFANGADNIGVFTPLFRNVGGDAGVVKHVRRQGDDRVEQVRLDNPAPDLGLTRAGLIGEQRRAVEDDGRSRNSIDPSDTAGTPGPAFASSSRWICSSNPKGVKTSRMLSLKPSM